MGKSAVHGLKNGAESRGLQKWTLESGDRNLWRVIEASLIVVRRCARAPKRKAQPGRLMWHSRDRFGLGVAIMERYISRHDSCELCRWPTRPQLV